MSDINLFTAAKAKKSLGQHFLRDERVVQRIVDLDRKSTRLNSSHHA